MDPVGIASRRLPSVATLVLAVLATAVLTLAATARSTVVSHGFYRSALDEEKAYDRLYSQVLVDPRTAAVTRGLLARLPVPEAQVTSNLKLVLPPETVRDLTQQQIDAVVGYLGGERDSLVLKVDLRPVLANLNDLAQIYFGDLVASVQNRRWLALATGGAAVAGLLLVPYAVTPTTSRTCEGRADLCDRSYDEVAYLTSHNAMSTTVDRFLGPLQDPGITAQLDDGVRALQIDTYRWERPDEITARLAESDFTPEQRKFITAAVNKVNPPREGLWLCHSVCRAGAIALVPALREIGDWMRAHPTEVITLIVQDAISGEDTQRAFAQAGLSDLVHTPDPDPAKPWPTLGDLIDSGRRLVVFAEQADGPAPWCRNFYDNGMETPFAFRTPDTMTCVPHRGGSDKRLFLLDHFITIDGGSRLDAGEVNARPFVLDRVHRCERERGRPVNFVAVDYTTIGDAGGAVAALNSER
ncbi:hypothetical protein OH768_48490 [Streptomyces sp. NBC_01622]|uniref:hypothetical protein n=1 Tax=Streptomyces sp. NBC_01622 TaxID=2975903 RepID=UPI00386C3C43|nr:hypothetical protein OH768_48490 [Streptomyces sp. NBC_01622]